METFHIQWHITDKCNLRCIDCYQEQYTRKGELPLEKLYEACTNLFQAVKKWNKKLTINLTGGEPLMRDDVWELTEYLNTSCCVSELGLITNGTLLDKHLPFLKKFGKLKTIYVSLDGVSPETNDSIRGAGTYEKTIENIRLLLKYRVPVTIMFTLMKKNLVDAEKLHDFALALGVDGYIIERFIPLGRGLKISAEVVNGEELNRLYETIFRKCAADYNPRDMVKYRAIRFDFLKDDILAAECIVARDGMALLPDATVLPCRRFNLPVGNLMEKPFYEIWENSEILNALRNKKNLKGRCSTCAVAGCIGCRAMVFSLTGDYLEEDPHCWLELHP